MGTSSSPSGWRETDGNTYRDIPIGWRKEWTCENQYGWVWYGPPYQFWRDLCVLSYEPGAAERKEIEERFKDAPIPGPP